MLDDNWTNARMRRLLDREWCPVCALLPEEHDDRHCDMRCTKEPAK